MGNTICQRKILFSIVGLSSSRYYSSFFSAFKLFYSDILGPALPLFTFPKSITWSTAVPKPKDSLHSEYLGYAIRAWSHLNWRGKMNVAGLVGVRKLELDRLAKSHSCPEMDYQQSTATYLVLGRLVQSIAFERMSICQGIRMSR